MSTEGEAVFPSPGWGPAEPNRMGLSSLKEYPHGTLASRAAEAPPYPLQALPVHIGNLWTGFSNKMQSSKCLAKEQEEKEITVNKVSVSMETIKKDCPSSPLLSG